MLKLMNTSDPGTETKRLEFWLLSIKKFSDQLRSLSFYEEKNQNNFHSQNSRNSFFQNSHHNRQGGSNLKLKCLICSNYHVSKKGTPSQYLALCSFFRDQNLAKQKELLKSSKTCHICLNPKSQCRENSNENNSPKMGPEV